MKPFARLVFRFIVYLYPRDFRNEFGDEMLWVFDEHMTRCMKRAERSALCTKLFFDAVYSAFLQHTVRERHRPTVSGRLILQMEYSARLIHVAQMGFIAFCCLFNLLCISFFVRMIL